jgi:hypothetical protein
VVYDRGHDAKYDHDGNILGVDISHRLLDVETKPEKNVDTPTVSWYGNCERDHEKLGRCMFLVPVSDSDHVDACGRLNVVNL